MDIAYSLVDNKLTAGHDRRAQVHITGTATIEDLAADIVRPGSTITRAEFLAMYEELKTAVIRRAQRGENVVTDLFVVRPSLTGSWPAAQDAFDPERHQGRLRLSAGTALRRAETELRFVQVRAVSQSAPRPEQVEDLLTEAINTTLRPGATARLRGANLKHNPTDPTQGVFLVPATGNGNPVRLERILKNTPSEQLFLVPPTLPAGTYRLEVRIKPRNSSHLRTGTLGAVLTVA
ncbi:DUF4469 domain-containing protein [Hymenobacter guriensis]|uniref:DUF4469 domain-containing protein n=1 Tax=Hymenobacter guriensis TaxID=2793065 RepID=A0ABS0L730_9BACT|nr:DUF4469 domain-containing protein [Hymenobacter guriensis]MBG8555946.1 DUF4469 domain-containing protein [Hymenobacter guriensis]